MNDFKKACLEIESYIGRGMHRGLDRIEGAVRLFSHPEKKYPTIHIAGTNGKGSTSTMVASILERTSLKVGLTTSPHVSSVRERLKINNEPISCAGFVELHDKLKEKLPDHRLTYYEWIILMAYVWFADHDVDLAIFEVGLGGRLDATNLINSDYVGITSIGYDHQAFLGETLEEILNEKSAIIKKDSKVIAPLLETSLKNKVKKKCDDVGALYISQRGKYEFLGDHFRFGEHENLKISLKGEHQLENAQVALGLIDALIADGYMIDEEAITQGLAHATIPLRLEEVLDTPSIILDGAHNLQGVGAIVSYLKSTGEKRDILFSCLNDRPLKKMVSLLRPVASSLKLAYFESDRGFKREEMELFSLELNLEMIQIPEDLEAWVRSVNYGFICGSLQFVSVIREKLLEYRANPLD